MLTTSCKAARAPECRCTHVRGRRCSTCVWSLARGKDVSCSDLNTIPRGRFFQDKPPISRFRFLSSRRRLARTAYARFLAVFCPRRGRNSQCTIANTCWYFCLARRHVCPVSGRYFANCQLCAKDKEKKWVNSVAALRFKNWWRFRFPSLLRWWKIYTVIYFAERYFL